MIKIVKKFFRNLKKEQQAYFDADRAIRSARNAIKESRSEGHPCPDYVYKNSLERTALDYARTAMTSGVKLHPEIEMALKFIVDADRLKKQNLPIPTDLVKAQYDKALTILED